MVVGSGITGLMSSYYLLRNKTQPRVIMLERDLQPYQQTSARNGNWCPTEYARSWLNWPFYPKIYRSVFDSQKFVSKTYLYTFVQDWLSFLITTKFAYKWVFGQLKPD